MTDPILDTIISLFIPWSLGFLTVLLILGGRQRLPFYVSAALGYGIGTGMLSQWMLALGILNIPFSAEVIGFPMVLILLYLLVKARALPAGRSMHGQIRSSREDLPLQAAMLLFIVFNILMVWWRATSIPISAWDEVATVAFKSKVLYYDRTLANLPSLSHAAYPLHIPFLQSWIAMSIGQWNAQLPKIIFPLAYLSYLAVHYWTLRQYAPRTWSLFGVVLLVSSYLFNSQATIGYRDLFLTYYNCSAFLLLVLWDKKGERSLLWLASLMIGFATFTKVEGLLNFILFSAVLVLILARKRSVPTKDKSVLFLQTALIPSLMVFVYWAYKMARHISLEEKATIVFGVTALSRFPQILTTFFLELFTSADWGLVWFLFVVSLLFQRPSRNVPAILCLKIAVLLHFLVLAALAAFTESFIWMAGDQWRIGLPRLIMHFFPLVPALIVLLMAPRPPTGNTRS